MDSNSGDEQLRKVMREADDYLDRLNAKRVELGEPTSVPSKRQTGNSSLKYNNPKLVSVSQEMLVRLESIDKVIAQGYQVKKIWHAFPGLVNSSGIDKSVLSSSPAGFSWIAFFFPFAVCTQIREWSYFFVVGSTYLAASIFHKISGWDPNIFAGFAISIQYGYYFPYLRWLAIQQQRPDLDKGISIMLGLVFSFVCVIPSMIFDYLFIK